MKSYYQHLSSRQEFGEEVDITKKPVFRSSAIFPVRRDSSYTTRILFLGYWLLKRKIHEVNVLLTLRNKEGKILRRSSIVVNSPRSYSIELDSLLENIPPKSEFVGSLEVEIFSTQDMVFPYPALVLNYHNYNFDTYVHTIGRIYNDFEDIDENEKFRVPETGFDIYANADIDSFLAFVNGPIANTNGFIRYTITNNNSQKFNGTFDLGQIKPYQTTFLKFKDYIPELDRILDNKPGTISVEHNFEGFYPRLLVGNIQHSFPCVSFTHSYYDCSSCSTSSDYWDRTNEMYYDGSVYVPLFVEENFYTELVIYPNFSPSTFDLHINFHDVNGNLIHHISSLLKISSNDGKLIKIDFKKLIQKYELDITKIKTAHVISDFKDKIPARLKFGLNVGTYNTKSSLPCNICFNAKLANPLIESKPGSFHWCPIFDNGDAVISIGNFSPKRDYQRVAKVKLRFYGIQESTPTEKEIILPPNGEFRLETMKEPDIRSLVREGPAWLTIEADNPNIQGFYFTFNDSGAVAGDHVF